jgi:Tfp pilus assembly protein PilF
MIFRKVGAIFLIASLAACAATPKPSAPVAVTKPVDLTAIMTAADAARENGRFDEAVQIYQQVLATDPKSTEAQYGTAECFLALGNANNAKSIFEILINDERYGALASQGVGLSELGMNQYEKATKALNDALAADQKLWRSYNGLATIADIKHRPDEAAALFGKAIALNPDSVVLLNNRGYLRLGTNKPDEAIADFRKALVLDPSSETVQNNLRLAYASKGNYAEATSGVGKEQQSMIFNNVGVIAMQRGDLAAAEGFFTRAMESSPSYNTVAAKNIERLISLKNEATDRRAQKIGEVH